MTKIDPAFAIQTSALALPGITHAFFTRKGGVSTGLYDSNNIAFSAADDPAHVAENRARATRRLGLSDLVTLNQKHTPEVIAVDEPWTRDATPIADALVTKRRGLALGILTADCAPVLFADAEAGVIGAAHAGWRGAFDGVIGNTVEAMEDLGAHAGRIVAVVGPCIAQASYEVGAEFVERFVEMDPELRRFFGPAPRAGHAYFNLPAFVAHLATVAGVGSVHIDGSDTCPLEDRFFSYRRSTLRKEADYGRQLSAIGLAP
ncbi:MAG: peptidoglycan editing factor PgeF [Proteobacteria bacterium]|nr:peptidoglycan editing factor PgeF [Pseudomonadota bacterium]